MLGCAHKIRKPKFLLVAVLLTIVNVQWLVAFIAYRVLTASPDSTSPLATLLATLHLR